MAEDVTHLQLGSVFDVSNQRLGDHIYEPRVLSLSKYDGFVPADEYFDKRIASAKLDLYKTVAPDEWAFSTIHIDEGSIARNKLGYLGAISPMYTTMRWASNEQDPAFFELLLRSPQMIAAYSNNAQGTVNRRRSLPWKTFAALSVSVPFLPVQRRIVDLVAHLDNHLVKLRAEKDTASTMLSALLENLVFDSTFVQRPLGELLECIVDNRGKTPGKLGTQFKSQGAPVISAINVKNRSLIPSSEPRYVDAETYGRWMKVPMQKGDVLLTSEGPLGQVAQIPDEQSWVLGQRLFGLRGHSQRLLNDFLFHFLSSASGQSSLRERSSGSTVAGIRQSELVKVSVPCPSIDEQLAICEVLNAAASLVASIAEEIVSSGKLRDHVVCSLLNREISILSAYDTLLPEVV